MNDRSDRPATQTQDLVVQAEDVALPGILTQPAGATSVVLFAHGSGSSRFSSRNRFVADVLNQASIGTLLFDLLTENEQEIDDRTRHLRFDIGLLSERLIGALDWMRDQPTMRDMKFGLFGASTGAAAALVVASQRPESVSAVVSRGGRPDLAHEALEKVQAPTLLIVGERDAQVIDLNRDAAQRLQAEHHIILVPGASHLFEEPGTLEQAANHARDWFTQHLTSAPRSFQPPR